MYSQYSCILLSTVTNDVNLSAENGMDKRARESTENTEVFFDINISL